MKKILFSLVLFLGLSISFNVFADTGPSPDQHVLNRCVKVVNNLGFKDVVVFQYVVGPMISNYEAQRVEYDVCLNKGYKINQLSLYILSKNHFELLDLSKLDKDYLDENFFHINNIQTYGGYLNNSNPLVKETIEYNIESIVSVNPIKIPLVLYKSKVISEYNNGNPPKIENYKLFLKNLKFGQKSEDVKLMQDFLIERGHLSVGNSSGYFGKLTKKALCDFQIAKGIYKSNNGICGLRFGPQTRAKINE